MGLETALLRRVIVGGNRCAQAAHPQAIGTVMAVLQGAYTDFLLKPFSRFWFSVFHNSKLANEQFSLTLPRLSLTGSQR